MLKINIGNKHKRLFLLQRNAYLSKTQTKIRKLLGRYLFTNIFINFFNPISNINSKLNNEISLEFNELKPFLPNQVKKVADIGCGLGIIDIFLYFHYAQSPQFTLIDKNFIEKKVSYGFNKQGQFYNNFQTTIDFLESHGLKKNSIITFDKDNIDKIDIKFDLVISLLSMGYHYPLTQYLRFLKKNTHQDTVFIFDIAKEYNKISDIRSLFNEVEIIKESEEIRHNYIRICCKKLLK